MDYFIVFLLGTLLGCISTQILFRWKTGKGYFHLEKIPDEEDLYTVNVRLIRDQQLNKKTRIMLTRE